MEWVSGYKLKERVSKLEKLVGNFRQLDYNWMSLEAKGEIYESGLCKAITDLQERISIIENKLKRRK